MKKSIHLLIFTLVVIACVHAQSPADTSQYTPPDGDSAMAAKIIDNYLGFIDFTPLLTDSVLAVVTDVVDRSHPEDTITIYRWYSSHNKTRIEMWQDGHMQDAYHSDGKSFFRRFSSTRREWYSLSQSTYYDHTNALDIRGALYNWRNKGTEAVYVGEYSYKDHPVYRVFVASPQIFDRNYFFEKETGLLFILTEENHILGDIEPAENATRVDWRAWHEFTPFHGFLLPSIESYQIGTQIVIMHHRYHLEPYNRTHYTEDFRKR